MGDQRQIRTRSWNRMPAKRCTANGIREEFIVVDDDEVIILDFPESSIAKTSGTSRTGNNSILQRVISIDDDDDDEETENVHNSGGSSSSDNPQAANLQTSPEVDNDDCQFIPENLATFKFSRCAKTSSTMPLPGFRFGLGSDTENELSESDCSDCEILDGPQTEVRQQWEKAHSRKMKKAGKAGASEEEAGPSSLHCDTDFNPGFESRTEQHDQTPFVFAARNRDGGKETSATFSDDRVPDVEENGKAKNGSTSSFCNKEDFPEPSLLAPKKRVERKRFDTPLSHFTSSKETSATFSNDRVPDVEENGKAKNCSTSSFCNKEDFPGPSLLAPKKRVERKRFDTPLSHFTSSKEPMHETFKKVAEQPDTVLGQCETSESPEENQKKNTKEVEEEEVVLKSSLPQTSDRVRDTTPMLDTRINGARSEHEISSLDVSREPIIDPIPSTSEQVQGINGTAPAIDVMLNREMLKETDDYKKAQEEEWESRQRQLQIQAEEAQRQRKRRKLENTRQMRQLEVERRQKERVEEVRETQKKDEESMNMKEKVRSEITKSLKQLERTSLNMATLLRGLGIHVNGGISPLPQDVHAAYKKALLRFHPDRSSRDDIKQQVEAEEKFKLISRMKDKLSFTSFR